MRPRHIRRATCAAVLTLLAALAAAGPASPDPGGAQVVKVDECQQFEDGSLFCTDTLSVFAGAGTPSGNFNSVQHVRFDNSFTSPDCNTRDQGSSRNHLLTKDGTDDEFHFAFKVHSTFDCAGFTRDCVTTLHFHRVNGVIQFNRDETVCREPL